MTTQEIYDEIIKEKECGKYAELYELNSSSKTAVWRLWIFVFAYFSKSIRDLFEHFKAYIESVFAKNQAGTLQWWIVRIKEFQYGNVLQFINGIYQYPNIDAGKQIIKQAAIEPLDRQLIIKVAKANNEGILEPLSEEELNAFSAYINRIKFPGTLPEYVSAEADLIRLNYRIYYNAQMPKSELEGMIADTINNYLAEIVFNARLSATQLTDELQKIEGIVNPVFLGGEAKNFYKNEFLPLEDYYLAAAGYMVVDELNLEFIPYVQY